MKNPAKILELIPKPVLEFGLFAFSVLTGSFVKLYRQNEAGVKMTIRKGIAETAVSFLIAFVVYAVFDQFFHFNRIFTYAMCSLAGSMSTKITKALESIFDKILLKSDGLLDTAFEKAKNFINNL